MTEALPTGEPPTVLRAARWLAHAPRDRSRATSLASTDAELAAFRFQQAAEKARKGVLVAVQEGFERTHSLDRLLVRAGRFAPEFLDCPGDPERVTAFVSRLRDPDEGGDDLVTAEDVAAARLVSERLVDAAKHRLAAPMADLAMRILADLQAPPG